VLKTSFKNKLLKTRKKDFKNASAIFFVLKIKNQSEQPAAPENSP
jgi:hypothetical protein